MHLDARLWSNGDTMSNADAAECLQQLHDASCDGDPCPPCDASLANALRAEAEPLPVPDTGGAPGRYCEGSSTPRDGSPRDASTSCQNAAGAVSAPWSATPPTAEPLTPLMVGERVYYWSDTHDQWMNALVQCQNVDEQGVVLSYDLNIKKAANINKMRRAPQCPPEAALHQHRAGGRGAADTVSVPMEPSEQVDAKRAFSGTAAAQALRSSFDDESHSASQNGCIADASLVFEVGDQVEYWSDTYRQWMQAVVRKVRDDGDTYDLDVKRGADRRKVRSRIQAGSRPAQAVESSAASPDRPSPAACMAPGGENPCVKESTPGVFEGSTVRANAANPMVLARGALGCSASFETALQGPDADDSSAAPPSARVALTSAGLQRLCVGSTGGASVAKSPPRPWTSGMGPAAAAAMAAAAAGRASSDEAATVASEKSARAGIDDAARSANKPTLPIAKNGSVTYTSASSSVTYKSGYTYITSPSTVQHRTGSTNRPGIAGVGTPTNASTPTPVVLSGISGQAASVSSISTGGASPANGAVVRSTNGHIVHSVTSGDKVVVRHLVADSSPAARQTNSFFMGTNADSQLVSENVASPVASGRGSVTSAKHRVSISSHLTTTPSPHAGAVVGGGACSSGRCRKLDGGELHMGDEAFNPSSPSLRAQLLQALGMSNSTAIEELQGFRGGLNDGVWFLSDPTQASAGGVGVNEVVCKLVRCHRIASGILTEAENLNKIVERFPSIVNDPFIAFPLKVFSCVATDGTKKHDLVVMKKVRGQKFGDLIAQMWYAKQVPRLMQIIEQLGASLGEFHNRYGDTQHGDFQPSNTYFDDRRNQFILIDVGGMGVPTMGTDVDHFVQALNMLSGSYSVQFAIDGAAALKRGYGRTRPRR